MKILIVKPSSFGDIVQANPALTALKTAFPDAKISWLVFNVWQDILSFFNGIDERIVWNKREGLAGYIRLIRVVRRKQFDLVIDLQGLFRSGLLTALSGAKRTIGVPGMKECSGLLVKEPFPESRILNAVHRSLESVRYLVPGKQFEPQFDLTVPSAAMKEAADLLAAEGIDGTGPIVGLVPFARGSAKEWPKERYEDLIREIVKVRKGCRFVVLGGRSDAGKIRGERTADLCGKTTMLQLGGVLKSCRIVAGSDTGPAHLAAALGVPVVMLFGGSDVRETAPVAKEAVVIKKDYACSPCRGKNTCRDFPCLRDITVDEVVKAMQRWIP